LVSVFSLPRPVRVVAVVADPVDLRLAVDRLRVVPHEPVQHPLAVSHQLGHRPPGTTRGPGEITFRQLARERGQVVELRSQGIDLSTVHAYLRAWRAFGRAG